MIYFDVKPLNMLSNREVETTFLKVLRRVLPIGVIPTIVTDSGYRNPWFKEVDRLGWYFVGRLAPLPDGSLRTMCPYSFHSLKNGILQWRGSIALAVIHRTL